MYNHVFLISTAEDLAKQRRMQRILELKAELEMLGVVVIYNDDAEKRTASDTSAEVINPNTTLSSATRNALEMCQVVIDRWDHNDSLGRLKIPMMPSFAKQYGGNLPLPTKHSSRPRISRNICRPRR